MSIVTNLYPEDFPLGRSLSKHPSRMELKQLIEENALEYDQADQKSRRMHGSRELRSRQEIISHVVTVLLSRGGRIKERTKHGMWKIVEDFEDRLRKRISNDFQAHIRRMQRVNKNETETKVTSQPTESVSMQAGANETKTTMSVDDETTGVLSFLDFVHSAGTKESTTATTTTNPVTG
jgi:hypothetical protein